MGGIRSAALLLAVIVQAGLDAPTASAETKSFAFSWFYPAIYSQPDNCPDGLNPLSTEIFRHALITTGKTPAEAEALIEKMQKGAVGRQPITERGTFDGKPANAYANPLTVPDPGFKTAQGRYAVGFNLDGKGAASANGFEDPETHEKGVNNQLFRILGCLTNHQAPPPQKPDYPMETWETVRDTMPAWLMSISGADLSKDGAVTVTLDRGLNHALRDAAGDARSDQTFRIDPDPRSHTVFPGRIKDGILTAEAPHAFIMGDQFFINEFDFTQLRLRLTLNPDGRAEGVMGGYLPWLPIYFQHGGNGLNAESNRAMDMVGLFRALMRMADAEPDPKTGQNQRISTAWRVEVVPAFAIAPARPPGTAQADSPIRTSQAR